LTNENCVENRPGNEIRQFILRFVDEYPHDIVKRAAEEFGVSSQAVRRHLTALVREGQIETSGQARRKRYGLKTQAVETTLPFAANQDEERVWRLIVAPVLAGLPESILRICDYGFTEMYNNAIEHSEGNTATARVCRSARSVTLGISDNGIGIFEKVRAGFNLEDERQAILELLKGKLTTDPSRHSGQGFFFAARLFDRFDVIANQTWLRYIPGAPAQWMIAPKADDHRASGTSVEMTIAVDSLRMLREVFDFYSNLESGDFEFSKTDIPLKLAQYGTDLLISRSQAKRILARLESFEEVFLDFSGVEEIGQAFADEIFRVYATAHPGVKLTPIHANDDVTRMIRRAVAGMKLR
jgi:anti-sigma regulatory factor (Ser/Thr protein kinase)